VAAAAFLSVLFAGVVIAFVLSRPTSPASTASSVPAPTAPATTPSYANDAASPEPTPTAAASPSTSSIPIDALREPRRKVSRWL
jgi:hypothetical protein